MLRNLDTIYYIARSSKNFSTEINFSENNFFGLQRDQTSPRQVCINCNCIAHLACPEALLFQNPFEMEFAVSVSDFLRVGKRQIRAIPKSQLDNIYFCILCKENIKLIKLKAKKMPNAEMINKFSPKHLQQHTVHRLHPINSNRISVIFLLE
jgi:hypothetical protein